MTGGISLRTWRAALGRSEVTIANQTIQFGALTLDNAGGAKAIASNGSEVDITSVSYVSGPLSTGWGVASNRLKNSGSVATANGTVLSCVTALGTIQVTISTIANGWSVASDAELQTAAQHTFLAYGHTIYLRTVTINGAYSDYRFNRSAAPTGTRVDPVPLAFADSGFDLTTCNYVKITPHTGANPVIGSIFVNNSLGANFGFWFKNLAFVRTATDPYIPASVASSTYMLELGPVNNIIIEGCSFTSTDMRSLNLGRGQNDIRSCSGIASRSSSVYIINNTITNCFAAIAGVGGSKIIGNSISRYTADAIQISLSTNNTFIAWNNIYDPFSMEGDPAELPHADGIQFFEIGATADTDNTRIIGNRVYLGAAGTDSLTFGQGIFLSDLSAPYYRNNVVMAGNLIYCAQEYQGLTVTRAVDPVIVNNTVLTKRPPVSGNKYWIGVANGLRGVVADNIANSVDISGQTPLIQDTILANETLSSGSLSYEGLFAGPFTEPIDPLVSFVPKSGGLADVASPKHGAVGTGYIDYDARTYDFPGMDPLLVSTSPSDNATSVDPAANITLTFDRNIQLGTGNIIIRQNNSGTWSDFLTYNAASAPQLSVSGRTLTINPTSNLDASKEYAVRIPATAIDLKNGGGDFAGITDDTTFSFTTATNSVTLVSSVPADDATNFYDADDIVLTFDRNIQFGTGNIVLRENNGGWADLATYNVAAPPAQISISGAVLTINPASNLTPGREYAIRIASTAIEKSGGGNAYAGIANDTTLSFTVKAAGITAPYFVTSYDFEPGNGSTSYVAVTGSHTQPTYFGTAATKHPMPCAGTAKNLHVRLINALAAGTSWQFSVMKNESAQSLAVTYTNGVDLVTDKADTSNSVSFAAGDFIGLRSNPVGSPTANAMLNMSFAIETSANEHPIFFSFGYVSAGATVYAGRRESATETQVSMVMPTAGTISDLYAYATVATGAGETHTATIFKNGVADATLQAQITNASSGRLASDTSGTVSVAAGDLISVRIVGSAGVAAAHVFCSAKFAPTISGEAVVFANLYNAGNSYAAPGSDGVLSVDTSNDVNPDVPFSLTARKLQIKPSAAPGSGNGFAVTLRKNVSDTALTVDVVNSETADINSATSVSFTQGDSISLKSTQTNFPSGGQPLCVGFVVRP